MEVSRQWTHDRLGKELRSFGHRLCSARESAGLDLEDVAQQTSLDRDRIASIERGHVDPFIDEVAEQARLYSVTLDYLSGLSDQRAPRVAANSRSTSSGGHTDIGAPGPVRNVEEGQPWEDHGPRIVKSIPLQDIDHTDKRFQFRFPSSAARLRQSLVSIGQRNPIKLMPGEDAYVIIDGFTRVAEARHLGWKQIKALIYPVMSEKEAKRVSWECNTMRKNLSFAEKANAMQMAANDGFRREEVARLFGVTKRTVDRHLELPQEILEIIDGKAVTMAHGKVLANVQDQIAGPALQDWAERIRSKRLSKAKLLKELRQAGLKPRRGREAECFCKVTDSNVRMYERRVTSHATTEELSKATVQLRAALESLEAMLASRNASEGEK